jgi:hypothetical protein
VAAAVGLIIGLAIVAVWVVRPTEDDGIVGDRQGPSTTEAATSISTTTTATSVSGEVDLGPVEQVIPLAITCSSEFNTTHRCFQLIDGDPHTVWNDAGLQGIGAVFTVTFAEPIALEQVHLTNAADDAQFRRSFRIRGIELIANDLPGLPLNREIPDDNSLNHVVTAQTLETTTLVIRVVATYPAEEVEGRSFDELALAELAFWGRRVGTADPEPEADLDTPGPLPGVFAVVRHLDLGNGDEIELNLSGECLWISTNFEGRVAGTHELCGSDGSTPIEPFYGSVGDIAFVAGTAHDPVAMVEVMGQGVDRGAASGHFLIVVEAGLREVLVRGLDSSGTIVEERTLDLTAFHPIVVRVIEFGDWTIELVADDQCLDTYVYLSGSELGSAGGCGADPTDVFTPSFGSVAGVSFVSGNADPEVQTVEVVGGGSDDASDGYFLIMVEPTGPSMTVRALGADGSVLGEMAFETDG